MRAPVGQPVCVITGELDPVLPASTGPASAAHVDGAFTRLVETGAGHFPHEERPERFNRHVLGWLASL